MNLTPARPLSDSSAKRALFWVGLTLLSPLAALGVILLGVASYFHLSSDTRALRNELREASGVAWRQQIGVNIGSLTFGVIRAGLALVPLDPEACAAVKAIRGGEVGIYELASDSIRPNGAAVLAVADRVLNDRGWERAVGVLDGEQLVGVYLPVEPMPASRLKCCVMIFDGRRLVVVRATVNLEPLLECLRKQTDGRAKLPSLAAR